MRHIGRLFSTFLNQHRIKETVQAAHICSITRGILHNTFGDNSSEILVRFVKNNTLHLECTSAAITSDIHMRRHDIRDAVNHALESKQIDSIQITTV